MSCAAANATIGIIEGENLAANAERAGRRLRDGLEAIKGRYPRRVGDVRGMGLMQGVELVEDEAAGDRRPARAATVRLFEETKTRGLLIGKGGLDANVLRIAPPLTVCEAEIDEALRILDESFAVLG